MRGFSLLELLCALTIVGILSAIAAPSYQNYLHQTYREQAKAKLVDLSASVAQKRLATSSGALPSDIKKTTDTSNADYQFVLTVEDNKVDYLLRATPLATGRQLGDGALILANTGAGCWHQGRDDEQAVTCATTEDHTW